MFLSKHLFNRNGRYYYRMAIPLDLKHLFPFREIKQSLNTDNHKLAESVALGIEGKVQQAFSILRSGVFSDETLPQIIGSIIPHVSKRSANRLLLSELMKKYIQQHEKTWVSKTLMEVKSECRLLLDVVGDKHINAITRQMILDARDTFIRLPANLYKRFPDVSIKQILCLPDISPMSLVSVNKHMVRLGAILRYGVREGFLYKNVAEAMAVPEKRSTDEERSIYSDVEIQQIISLLTSPHAQFRAERKWIPLIGIFSGMRLDEICQLYLEDIQQVDDIWCFDINDAKDKKLKNLSSRRIVPVHPFLMEQGLLKHVEEMRSVGQKRLWPCLTYSKIMGYSNTFGKWYQRFNREHITQDKRKVFHSFRHSFANKLKQQGVDESIIAELMGHKNHSITTGRYGKKLQLKVLVQFVQKIIWGN